MADQLPRKLAAVFYADVVDYSRLTGADEDTTHRRLSEYLDLVSDLIARNEGKVIHYAGDAVLADFSTVTSALECAQKALAADPSCADAYGLLAMYHLEVKAFDQAKEMAEKAISLAPNNAQNMGEVSMVLNKTGNPQRALELKKRRCVPARCIVPDFSAVWACLITCWVSLIRQLTPSSSL